jgi:hypothetical protein
MYFEKVPVFFSTVGDLKYGAAFTLPGIGIFINPNDRNNIDALRHEFGHWLVAKKQGKGAFYLLDIPMSVMSAMLTKDNNEHQNSITEIKANNASYLYFGRPADWNFKVYHLSDSVRFPKDPEYVFPNIDAGFASGFHY